MIFLYRPVNVRKNKKIHTKGVDFKGDRFAEALVSSESYLYCSILLRKRSQS